MADDRGPAVTEDTSPPPDLDEREVREAAIAPAYPDETGQRPDWSTLWQIPAIVGSVLLIVIGVVIASRARAPENDFAGTLDQVEALIGVGDFDTARTQLEDVLRPNLTDATAAEQARFHALAADWISTNQAVSGVSAAENNRLIAEQYGLASELGGGLGPSRLERWANALIDLGEVVEARKRLVELEGLGVVDAGDETRDRRNRVLRRLVKRSLDEDDASYEAMSAALDDFRRDPLLQPDDRAWAISQQARLRLEAGDVEPAVDHLLVDLRRLEQVEGVLPDAAWGELYTLLALGYYRKGEYDHARFHLETALTLLDGAGVARGEALLLEGRILVAESRHEAALERFDEVVREYQSTAPFAAALLARAETLSILGRHPASLDDYRALIELLPDAEPRRDVTRRAVAASLADRHDAALTTGSLPLALQYVSLAEALFEAGAVPLDVLHRIATTSSQIADDITNEATAEGGDVDPRTRHRTIEQHARAGEYFLRHARALMSATDSDDLWAESLWLAAHNFDRAGRRQAAIEQFQHYIEWRPIDDPRRAEVTFRLGQALEAEMQYEQAVEAYQRVIEERPRGVFGTGSHVPLARCLLALDRVGEAEQQLLLVVEGRESDDRLLEPDAVDYVRALFELGRIYAEDGRYRLAIERLTIALERAPGAPEATAATFRLADSYRRLAAETAVSLRTETTLAPADRLESEQYVRTARERAQQLFAEVIETYRAPGQEPLNRLEAEYLRLATFARADCVFDLGRFDEAAKLYDVAARRYGDHHSSMDALVQIVNCYERLGDDVAADIAHSKALIRLRQLPRGAFEDPQALMDRDAWERWLQSRPVGRTPDTGRTNQVSSAGSES